MKIQAEVDEKGVVRINNPALYGKKITLALSDKENEEYERETDWEAIKEIFKKADKMDFPRRTHEEIINDLHELRG